MSAVKRLHGRNEEANGGIQRDESLKSHRRSRRPLSMMAMLENTAAWRVAARLTISFGNPRPGEEGYRW